MTQEQNTQASVAAAAAAIEEAGAPTEQQVQQPDTVKITDLDTFVKVLSAWHSNKVALLNHMLIIPEGAEVEIGEVVHKLEGDFKQGYLIGLHVALHELGTLPFGVEFDESDAPFDLPQAANDSNAAPAAVI